MFADPSVHVPAFTTEGKIPARFQIFLPNVDLHFGGLGEKEERGALL